MNDRKGRFVSHPDDDATVIEGHAGADYYALMTEATRQLLIERGLLIQSDIDAVIASLEAPRPEWGAMIVARAWRDDAYRARLLADGSGAAAEMGFRIKEAQLVVVENSPTLHNLVVCTLCSCYPRSLLGQPPWWYISKSYRARAVREPRRVLAELGLVIPPEVELRVHDSNADMRYLVLPMAPADSGTLDEAALAKLVTRDAMIGASLAGKDATMPFGRSKPHG
ncbi:nitrile hydratase [Bosea sp. CRIB-10]|uniref:nitrile hydratase subunit alpha n=1 Tax=Bosea sp. CRIB-10 TaxID=378404 RepID=UPI0008E02DBC|nr:nitrile hydratase subunit alpha [Bosea sp. CRIB-10]SFD52190.1 nitrile hydratase [Bosea sp. CRIB-10]